MIKKEKNSLEILMTGLCVFVPKKKIEKFPQRNQMRVLLVESSSGVDVSSMDMNFTHEPHVPVLVAPNINVDCSDGCRQPNLTYRHKEVEWAVFYLDGQDLAVKGAHADRLDIVVDSGAGVGYPSKTNRRAFEWVPSFAKISHGSEFVDKACLRKNNVDPSIVARLELWEGSVFSEQIASDENGSAFLWKYKVPNVAKRGPSHRQAATHIVGFETDFVDSVELLTKQFGHAMNLRVEALFGKSNQLSIRLIPKGPEKIVIWVKNMPWADILATREPEGYRDKPDVHFGHLYKVSSNYEDVNVPHLAGTDPKKLQPRHQGNPNCQPVRAAANKKA
jgi:hypothetical protein